jgi:hypothetical protein
MGAVAGRLRANLSLSWRWFNYWRRRYVWLRLLILLAVFAQPIYEIRKPLIRELVIIAIKGIESAKFGPYLETRAIQHQEKSRLQRALAAHFDTNGDRRLSTAEGRSLHEQTGLTREQVEGRALDVELDALVAANHAVELLSRTRTANDLRREALAAALAEHQREHEAVWEEIGPDLEMQYPTARDYLRWETWRHGLASFLDVLRYRLPLGPHLIPGPRLYEASDMGFGEQSLWQNMGDVLVVLVLAGVVLVSIRRYGKGTELERRFVEEPSLAAAPCPVCGTPTHDYGALAQHRGAQAWAGAAVAGLTAATLWLSATTWCEVAERLGATGCGRVCVLVEPFASDWARLISLAVIMVATGITRWALWPREVHLGHRRPSARVAGFALGVVLVVGLVFSIGLTGVRMWRPARVAVVVGSRPERRPTERRGQHRPVRGTPKESSTPAMTRSPARDAGIGRGVRGAERRAEPRRRAQRRDRPEREERGQRRRQRSSGAAQQ